VSICQVSDATCLQIVLIQVPLANPWQTAPENSFAFGVGHLKPSSRGYLELVDNDPATPPKLELNYLNGVTVDQVKEVLMQTAFYCGGPAALEAFRLAAEVIDQMDTGSR